MDAITTAVLGAAPQLGISGILLSIIVLLIRRESQTTERHAAELDRLSATHAAEVTALRAALDASEREADALHDRLDEERERRRAAEDQRPTLHPTPPGSSGRFPLPQATPSPPAPEPEGRGWFG